MKLSSINEVLCNEVVLRTNGVVKLTLLCYNKVAYRGDVMKKEDKLGDLSMQLSVDVLSMCKALKKQGETVISNQISRSATSICANIAESKYAHGRADFIAKLHISLKEASETGKWLEMLYKTESISEEQYKHLNRLCSTIRVLLIKSINTAKENMK